MKGLVAVVSFAIGLFGHAAARADAVFPVRPLTLVVTQAAGGGMDSVARTIGQKLTAVLGQPVIIENKPGAAENIGINSVAKAAPDGYTLLLCSNSITINPALYRTLPYDAKRELQPIGKIASVPLLLVASSTEPYRDLSELVAYAKANPNKLFYGSPGTGSAHQLGMELIKSAAGIAIQHVPYKGAAPGINDILAGTIPLFIASLPPVEPHIKSGRIRAIATTNKTRIQQLDKISTVGETLRGFELEAWISIFAPAGVPLAIAAKLTGALKAAVQDADVVAQLQRNGMVASWAAPEELTPIMMDEESRWAAAIKHAGIKPE